MVKANHALSNSAQNYKMEELVNSSNPQKFWSTVKNLSTKSVNSQDLTVPVGKLYTNFVREVCLIFHGKSVVERHWKVQVAANYSILNSVQRE